MPTIRMDVGDTAPPAEAFLRGRDGVQPLDLTNKTIAFRAWRHGVATINGASILYPGSLPTDGHVVYQWASADTVDANAGWHECKWEVTDSAGHVSSYPTDWEDPLRLHISRH